MAFLTCSTSLEFDIASICLSTADLFKENPPIIGNMQFTTAAKAPGWANAYTPIKIKAMTIAK